MVRLFIVEDDKSIMDMYVWMINELSDYEVMDTAENGLEAVEKYRNFEHKPDLVLMDHRMPIKNGLQAATEILEMDDKAKILFASADDKKQEEILATGAIGFLKKPFDLNDLLVMISKIL